MNKMEYLKQLENALKGKVSTAELDDIIRDYAEYFEEGKKQGKTEDEISQKLGIPFEVAQQILSDDGEVKSKEKEPGPINNFFGNMAKAVKTPRPPKPPKEPKPPKPPKAPKQPRAKREMGCLSVFLIVLAVLALLPLAVIGVSLAGAFVLAVVVCGAALGAAGILAWGLVSVCSAFLPPVAVAAGVVLGLAMISVCITILVGICWGVVSLCKALVRLCSGAWNHSQEECRQQPAPVTEELPASPLEEEVAKEEGDDQTC